MKLKSIEQNWNKFGETDPLWSILTAEEKKYNKWKPEEFFKTGETEIQAIMDHLRVAGFPIKNERVLDFGCGVGRLSRALSFYFKRVDGVDISSVMIDRAKELNCKKNCFFHYNPKSKLSLFKNESFDLIISLLTLQHMKKSLTVKYLKEFSKLLKPGGVLVFNIPSKFKKISLRKIITPKFYIEVIYKIKKMPLMEMYAFKKEKLLKVLKKLKFEIIKIEDISDSYYVNYKYYYKKCGNENCGFSQLFRQHWGR